jgi:hypothetical protein
MNRAIGLLLCNLAVAVPAWHALAADTPQVKNGRVLVLDNQRALEGEIRYEGGNYCVRRAAGEVWLSPDKVLALCASWDEAFAFVRSHANLRDPDERLRLAHWCQTYGLRAHALAEATAALQMRPSHAPSRQLVTLLEHPPPAIGKTSVGPRPPDPQPQPGTAPAIDLSAESLAMFTARVQPVLMNTCASCHAGNKTNAFRLQRASGTSTAARRATQQNMMAVLAQIDPARPGTSRLLLRAVSDHGKVGQAPIKAQSPPYHILHDWIHLTLATNPFLREQRFAQATTPDIATKEPADVATRRLEHSESPTAAVTVQTISETKSQEAPVISRPMATAGERRAPADSAPRPANLGPVDDFDPALFNRQFHPAREQHP